MKKYVIVGAGVRALHMFARPITTEFQDVAQLAAICDVNIRRAEQMSRECGNAPVYTDFDQMITEIQPDAVIITTPDHLHHEYIIRALEAGCDAISEKPMTTDAEKCRSILEAEQRTGKKVIVTFNCRFMPYVVRIKELLREGVIGDIQSVHLEWFLDRDHGADYFRRWHRRMEKSGGLLVHKSTHHFDMVNWWLEDEPDLVFAHGATRVYGPTREERGRRCLTCDYKSTCEFYFDVTANDFNKSFYYDAESMDGYYRDQCIFGDDVDIYDTMSVNVKYRQGALLTYSLTAYNPVEGWKASFVGTKGRLETQEYSRGPEANASHQSIRLYNLGGELLTYTMPKAEGVHGGGDQRLHQRLFNEPIPDPLEQQAGSWAGAMSVMIGASANRSIAEGKPFSIQQQMKGLG
ncbi:Gfo/Idh/MocA family protein [Paenibacillus sp. J2TS4]|uniref:Gfo/Idh/MocA family protein n=1 Tax=Paenibacillus sp. J2TS4 TaxID=2807194 RepID=UPI001B1F13BD|nr:Gfo/Idh/MocA family oxidoreductase [Paenibacillus sp. J2TS4]GIP31847.1 4,5-dihydroxyphthalate dehydrogenase [Paenibacillus sp. J2TS4]